MSGIFWPVFVLSAIALFIIAMIYRLLSISRQPVHLRWELAPIPHVKGRGSYGGSDLEEFERWNKHRRRCHLAPLSSMAAEILLMRGVWKNNERLWPFSLAMHLGVYLVILTVFFHIIIAIFIINGVPLSGLSLLPE